MGYFIALNWFCPPALNKDRCKPALSLKTLEQLYERIIPVNETTTDWSSSTYLMPNSASTLHNKTVQCMT